MPVPFSALEAPPLAMKLEWTFQRLVGCLMTWSSLQRYLRETGRNPLEPLLGRLEAAWAGSAICPVSWPLFVRVFRV